jgi:hypothetical protein
MAAALPYEGGLDEIDTCIICVRIGDGVLETDRSLCS